MTGEPVQAEAPTASWKFQSTAEKVSIARYIVVDFCWAHGVPAERLEGLGVAVSEVVTNAIQHAYPGIDGEIEVAADVSDREVVITVADAGAGADLDALRTEGQMGLKLAGGFADRLEFSAPAQGSGLVVRLAFPRA